jgi:hypothetical protein
MGKHVNTTFDNLIGAVVLVIAATVSAIPLMILTNSRRLGTRQTSASDIARPIPDPVAFK